MHEDKEDQSRVAPSVPCVAPTGSTAEPQSGAVTADERPEMNWRQLATMLAFLARDMRTKKYARVSVPIHERQHGVVGFDRFTRDDVEAAQLEPGTRDKEFSDVR